VRVVFGHHVPGLVSLGTARAGGRFVCRSTLPSFASPTESGIIDETTIFPEGVNWLGALPPRALARSSQSSVKEDSRTRVVVGGRKFRHSISVVTAAAAPADRHEQRRTCP
jgi:hypothetical protein